MHLNICNILKNILNSLPKISYFKDISIKTDTCCYNKVLQTNGHIFHVTNKILNKEICR